MNAPHPYAQPSAEPYPDDLSDLSPRLLEILAAQGVTAEEIQATRRALTPTQTASMRHFEAQLAAQGVTLEDLWDPTPLTPAEQAEFDAWLHAP